MPAVEGRVEFPAVQILEGEHVSLDEPKALDDRVGCRHGTRRIHGPPRDRRGLDLHLRPLAGDHDARVAAPASGDAARVES